MSAYIKASFLPSSPSIFSFVMEPVGGSGARVGGSSSDSGPCRVLEFIGGGSGCGAQSIHVLSVGGPGSVEQHFFRRRWQS